MKNYRYSPLILFCLILLPTHTFADELKNSNYWLANLDNYVKVFGAIVAALGTILGLPLAILNFKKTRVEIKKLELESANLSANSVLGENNEQATNINIVDSPNARVQVLADPKFLGPLLLLLDFIIAFIIMSLAGYLLNLLNIDIIGDIVRVIIAAVLFVPILRASYQVRANLKV